MKRKIYAKFILISAIAVMGTVLCAMLIFYEILKEQIFEDLEAESHELLFDGDLANDNLDNDDDIIE